MVNPAVPPEGRTIPYMERLQWKSDGNARQECLRTRSSNVRTFSLDFFVSEKFTVKYRSVV